MRGIDVGQPTRCSEIDCLILIPSHSLLARSRNDELRQISDRGAPAWSCINPPTLRCSCSWGGAPQTSSHHPCLATLWLMHSSVLFLFVLMTTMSLVAIWWLFANTADASAYPYHFFPSPYCERTANVKPESFDMTVCQIHCREPHNTLSTRDTGNTWAEEMSSDNISACWDVLCFVDKAIIHHYALDSRNPLSISGIYFLRTVGSLIYSCRWDGFYY